MMHAGIANGYRIERPFYADEDNFHQMTIRYYKEADSP
jgi:hypothetical protein